MIDNILQAIYKIKVMLFIIFICAALHPQSFAQDLSEFQKEVWEEENKYWNSWQKNGIKSIQAFHDQKALLWAANAAFPTDRTNARSYFDDIGDMVDSYELELNDIVIYDNVAVVQYYAKIISVDKPIMFRISHTWVKKNANWLIIGAMHTFCSKLPNCL